MLVKAARHIMLYREAVVCCSDICCVSTRGLCQHGYGHQGSSSVDKPGLSRGGKNHLIYVTLWLLFAEKWISSYLVPERTGSDFSRVMEFYLDTINVICKGLGTERKGMDMCPSSWHMVLMFSVTLDLVQIVGLDSSVQVPGTAMT